MRAALKSIEHTQRGVALPIQFGGETILLDPAGVLFVEGFDALIVSDLHLEKGSSFARRGQLLPPYDTAATLARLSALVAKYDPKIVISLGDSFHDDEASHRLSGDALASIQTIAQNRRMIWVTGNHDPSPPDHLPGECALELALGSLLLRHIPSPAETGFEIAGHLHPCAVINVRSKRVRRACFACDGRRMIMPSFGVMTGGLNIRDSAFNGLFHRGDLRAYMQGRDQIYPIASKDIVGL